MQPIPLEQLALSFLPHFGPVRIKRLVSQLGSPEAVFHEKLKNIRKVTGVGNLPKSKWKPETALEKAHLEIEFIQKNNIQVYSFWNDDRYPKRLKHCMDGPVNLFGYGNMNLNPMAVVSIVGTRNASDYGKDFVKELIQSFKDIDVLVVSGLAYGIDISAHQSCVEHEVSTVGVMAHGLDRIYPKVHKKTVKRMTGSGGVLTEFPINTNPDRENFPKRNRIVAGMADVTIVIESGLKGGSMITADLANSYNRDVFALPGSIRHEYSRGCNHLIKNNGAGIIDDPEEFLKTMGWDNAELKTRQPTVIQTNFFPDLDERESRLVEVMKKYQKISVDVIALKAEMNMSQVSSVLLGLEFKGVVKSLPGKVYQIMTN